MITQDEIKNMHNGLHRCPLFDAARIMPEISSILFSIPYSELSDLIIDVKVHMLMPGQFPCIPNWHYDNIPRNDKGKQDFSKVLKSEKMFIWVSNDPVTEFKNENGKNVLIEPQKWLSFTQMDLHRGTVSDDFCWRLFIRACPSKILKPNPPAAWIRRHSQVYLDSNKFKW